MSFNQTYTIGDSQNVVVGIRTFKIEYPPQHSNSFKGTVFSTIALVEIVPPAADQKDKEIWEKLHVFHVFFMQTDDPKLQLHEMSLGESIVFHGQLPNEAAFLLSTDFQERIDYKGFEELTLMFGQSLPLIALLKDPLEFPEQIKLCAAHQDHRYQAIAQPMVKKLQSLRKLNGVPQAWLEDYRYFLLDSHNDSDVERAPEVQAFIDNYVEEDEDEYR